MKLILLCSLWKSKNKSKKKILTFPRRGSTMAWVLLARFCVLLLNSISLFTPPFFLCPFPSSPTPSLCPHEPTPPFLLSFCRYFPTFTSPRSVGEFHNSSPQKSPSWLHPKIWGSVCFSLLTQSCSTLASNNFLSCDYVCVLFQCNTSVCAYSSLMLCLYIK